MTRTVGAALVAFLIAGCAHRSPLEQQTSQAYSDCLHRHPDGEECESLSRQVSSQEAARAERRRAIMANLNNDDPPVAPPRHRTTCKPNGLGGLDCD